MLNNCTLSFMGNLFFCIILIGISLGLYTISIYLAKMDMENRRLAGLPADAETQIAFVKIIVSIAAILMSALSLIKVVALVVNYW